MQTPEELWFALQIVAVIGLIICAAIPTWRKRPITERTILDRACGAATIPLAITAFGLSLPGSRVSAGYGLWLWTLCVEFVILWIIVAIVNLATPHKGE